MRPAPVTQAPSPAPAGSAERAGTHAIALLAAVALCYLGVLEVAARTLYPAYSTIEKRLSSDWRAAVTLGADGPDERRDFVLVGNSLLQQAVDRERLRVLRDRGDLTVAVVPVENTAYLDWYFGLERLLTEGASPQFVVLTLDMPALISNGTEGTYFARNLMRRTDILRVKRAAHLDWTTTSTYLMASFSAWIASGPGIRNWIKVTTLPGMVELARYFPEWRHAYPPADTIEAIVAHRLAQFSAVCATHGCRALLLIPPMVGDPGDGSLAAVARAASAARVTLVIPIAPAELGSQFFSDGYHLNAEGAARFTPRLFEVLRGFK